jgi:hypothetical protein
MSLHFKRPSWLSHSAVRIRVVKVVPVRVEIPIPVEVQPREA